MQQLVIHLVRNLKISLNQSQPVSSPWHNIQWFYILALKSDILG